MRVIRTLMASGLILGLGFVLWVYSSGVELVLENQSGEEIQSVNVSYSESGFFIDRIYDKGIVKKSLGKIGEGVLFDIRWQEVSGLSRRVKLGVYFNDLFGYNTIRIWIMPGGEALLFDGKNLQKSVRDE